MADTTTPNYALVNIQIGASRDTWGDKINANSAKIDTAIKAAADTAGAALPKAGGTVIGEILRQGQGALGHWSDAALADGTMFLTPVAAPSPLTAPGQFWFGY